MRTRGLVLLIIGTLGLSLVAFFGRESKHPFASLPGTYACKDFGLPDATHERLRIDPDFKVFGVAKSHEFYVGTLNKKDEAGELELGMTVIHAPTFKLDPFFPIRIEGVGSGIHVTGKGPDGEFKIKCRKWS